MLSKKYFMSFDTFEIYYYLLLKLIDEKDVACEQILNLINSYKIPSGNENRIENIKIVFDSYIMNIDNFFDKYIKYKNKELIHVIVPLIYFGNINFAKNIIDKCVSNNVYNKSDEIIKRIYGIIENMIKANDYMNVLVKSGEFNYVKLKEKISLKSEDIKNINNLWEHVNVFAYRPQKIEKQYPFIDSFKEHPKREIFEKNGFNRHIWTDAIDKIYILHNAQIAGYDWKTRTLFDEDNSFYPQLSGKFALLMNKNIYKKSTKNKKYAYCLPFPHNSKNYYHVMSEVVYGLRYVKYIDIDNINIIYENNNYNLLKYFALKMDIDFDRFVNVNDILDIKYNFIFSPDKPPYYWDKKCFEFFSQFRYSNNSNRKIYISRINSHDSRKLINEADLENELKMNGVDIIRAEELSIEEQIEVFSSASTVIGPHGAGFTNILFCNPGFRFVELFSDKYIVPDFYLRSQHINAQYTPHICENNKIDIDTVVKSIYE